MEAKATEQQGRRPRPPWQGEERRMERRKGKRILERWEGRLEKERRREGERGRQKRQEKRKEMTGVAEDGTPDPSLDGEVWTPSDGESFGASEETRLIGSDMMPLDAKLQKEDASVSPGDIARAVTPVHVSLHYEGESHEGKDRSPPGGEADSKGNLPAQESKPSTESGGLPLVSWLEQVSDAWAMTTVVKAVEDCKAQPTGKEGKGIFPLPTAPHQLLYGKTKESKTDPLVCNMCRALNSMYGCEVDPSHTVLCRAQSRVMAQLERHAETVRSLPEKIEPASWGKLFAVKGVDYKGDEVFVAKTTSWGNVCSALPREVAQVNLEDVCTGGVHHYVQHFDDFVLDDEDLVFTKPRVMVVPEDWEELAQGLVKA